MTRKFALCEIIRFGRNGNFTRFRQISEHELTTADLKTLASLIEETLSLRRDQQKNLDRALKTLERAKNSMTIKRDPDTNWNG